MAEIQIKCPECGNQRGVPDDLVGKKIKCKKCQSVFTVKAPPKAAPTKPAKAAPAKPPADIIPIKKDEEEKEDRNPYRMREENLAARCPFCAMLMDPPDSKICLHCGYDMQKRKRVEKKIVYETTAADYILWHLSTFGCFVVISIIVGWDVFFQLNYHDWFENDFINDGCFNVWNYIFSLFGIFFAGRFIFRKLVWRFHPPEHEKKAGDMDDDDYEDDDYDDDDDD